MFENVLIADDDPVSRRLLEVSLSNAGYRATMATNGTQALRILEEQNGPRLAVLDWMMPEMDGIEVCRAIRNSARERYIYIILLTARGHQSEIVQGLEAGADDYVTKPFDLHELKARLRARKRTLELQEQLVTAREELRVQATHDSLTGLLNRRAILEVLEKELARSVRKGQPVAIIMADLDYFKRVNDTHGHPAGDTVLRETARRMLGSVRTYDSVGRYGGEEFVVVAPGCDLTEAVEQAERLRACISAEAIREGDITIATTMSLGVTATTGGDAKSGQLLLAADEALYAAKHGGRNRVAVNALVTA
jgi:two-component system, cell cycle response regulator